MAAGKFTDTGYRLRKNVVNTSDSWLTNAGTNLEYYNLQLYNHDTFNVGDDFQTIGTMFFRLDIS